MADTPRIPVRVRGTIRNAALDSDGTVRVIDDVLSIVVLDREYKARFERIDGVVWDASMLAIHVGRDVVELTGHPGLEPLGAQIVQTALALPEFTRTMRGLGSRRGTVGADHDRFFAQLLAARRAAEGFAEPESRLAAFDARRLSQALTTLLGELAFERYPESGPDRRALEAELLDHAERMFAAMEALGEAADQVRTSTPASRLAQWRLWTSSAQRLFEEADRCWFAIMPALSQAPVRAPRRRFWRRASGRA
ncbi:MAG TPA: hypothetical protein VFW03_14980 [Gemmatimonadaceae bacterium]|nr:hypothetical protein [Gemmatimonadaceae bacterium]